MPLCAAVTVPNLNVGSLFFYLKKGLQNHIVHWYVRKTELKAHLRKGNDWVSPPLLCQ